MEQQLAIDVRCYETVVVVLGNIPSSGASQALENSRHDFTGPNYAVYGSELP